jgi:hypothetical protein
VLVLRFSGMNYSLSEYFSNEYHYPVLVGVGTTPAYKGKIKMATAIFESDNSESPIQTVRSTMSVSIDDSGTPTVTFATNRGKGSGSQSIPVDEFREAVGALQELAERGFERDEVQPSVADTIRSTASCEDGMVSFRTRSGKGSKPARISADSFAEVVSLLASTIDAVEAAGHSLAPTEPASAESDD